MKSLQNLKKQFPILNQQAHGHPLVYLDNAATTQKPESVIQALDDYYRTCNANVHRASHYLSAKSTQAFEDAREQVRHFLNAASSDEVIWTRGATEAMNLVAQSWGRSQLQAGDEILLSAMEHHANIVPWQLVAEQTGAVIRVITLTPSGELDLDSFRSQLSDKTRMLAVTHVSNAIGTINPIQTLIAEAKALGVTVLIDGSQAVAHTSVDVQSLGCDFYVFSGHKVFGPTGIGVLYGKKGLLEHMPPWQSGGEMIRKVSFSGTSFNTLPFKFEAGTPNVAGAIGLAKAIEFMNRLDMQVLAEHEQSLRQIAEAGLKAIAGVRIIGEAEKKAAVVSFIVDGFHNQDIGLLLDQQGIAVRTGHHCAMPLTEHLCLPGTIRVSFSVYNTEEDVERFLTALAYIVRQNPETSEPVGDIIAANTPENMPDIYKAMPGAQSATFTSADVEARLLKSRAWQDKYRHIMLMGKTLPAIPEEWKTESAQLQGCENTVWLHHHYDNDTMTLHFAADSDARVIRGLIAVVLAALNGKSPEPIRRFDINHYFQKLELLNHLSPSRGNGLRAIVREIHSIAHRYQ